MLYVAGFEIDENHKVNFPANKDVRNKINPNIDTSNGLTLSQAKEWFLKARTLRDELKSSSDKKMVR